MNSENERELDARIAEGILGLPTQFVKRRDGYLIPEDYYLVQEHPNGSGKDFRKLPSYSSDPNDAWVVVEKMILDKWSFRLSCDHREGGRWEASFADSGSLEGTASDFTFTHAICLAALKAIATRQAGDKPQAAHNSLAEAPA